MWADGDIVWVLMDVRPSDRLNDARNLAVAARDAAA